MEAVRPARSKVVNKPREVPVIKAPKVQVLPVKQQEVVQPEEPKIAFQSELYSDMQKQQVQEEVIDTTAIEFQSGFLAGTEEQAYTGPAFYPEEASSMIAVDLRANPLQAIKVDVSSLALVDVLLESNNFWGGPDLESEFFLLVNRYLNASKSALTAKLVKRDSLGENVEEVVNQVWHLEKQSIAGRSVRGASGMVDIPLLDYDVMVFKQDVADRLNKSIYGLRLSQVEELTQLDFNTNLAFLHVNTHISSFIYHSPLFSSVTEDLDLSWIEESQRAPVDRVDIVKMRNMIQVLFHFYYQHPEKTADDLTKFYSDIQNWLLKLCQLWQRVASYEDHLFLFSKILSCRNISQWGENIVQLPSYPRPWSMPEHHFFIRMLKFFLSPAGNSSSSSSIIIRRGSKDGSEADGGDGDFGLTEEDYICILRQFPFEACIRSIFSERPFDIVFGLASDILNLICSAFSKFSHFKHFVQRLCSIITNLLSCATDYTTALLYQLDPNTYRSYAIPIKTSFDRMCATAFKQFFSLRGCGVWQFLVHIPYHALSSTTAYHLFDCSFSLGIHCGICAGPQVTAGGWMSDVGGSVNVSRKGLLELLEGSPEAEFLISAWMKLALGQEDDNLRCILIHEIFVLGYIYPEASFVQKTARSSLREIILAQPTLNSFLLSVTNNYITALGDQWNNLWSRIPLDYFTPTYNDLVLIEEWIGDLTYGNPHQLAKYVLEHLNWKQEGFIGPDVHTHVALMIGKKYTSMKEVAMASQGWLWGGSWKLFLAFKEWSLGFLLKLRQFNSFGSAYLNPLNIDEPTISFLGLSGKAASATHDPLLSYLALQTTNVGRSPKDFSDKGLVLVKSLIVEKQFLHVLRVLHDIFPFVFEDSLSWANHSNIQFASDILHAVVLQPNGEAGIPAVASILSSQLMNAVASGIFSEKLLLFWFEKLMQYEGWSENSNFLQVLDVLFQIAYYCQLSKVVREPFDKAYKIEQEKLSLRVHIFTFFALVIFYLPLFMFFLMTL